MAKKIIFFVVIKYSVNIPIIFVRYAPGSCGTFLITVLSTAVQTACWLPEMQAQKNSKDFAKIFFAWFQTRFTGDLYYHLKNEPHHPYKLDFWSSKHPRGDDISNDDFHRLLQQRDDRCFLQNIKQNKKTLLRLNKSVVPNFGLGSPVVNITIDDASKRWLNRTRWIKLFGKEHNHYILKEQHPAYLAAKKYTVKFNNPYKIASTHHGFIKQYVINDPVVRLMSDPKSMVSDPSNDRCQQLGLDLSELLDPDTAQLKIHDIANTLRLELDQDLVKKCCIHYYNTNVAPLLRSKS